MKSSRQHRRMCFESMEKRDLFAADLGLDPAETPKIAVCEAAEQLFMADSFSFGVEREMKESGEKGGTEDINIGVGELQECAISKSADTAPTSLARFAINENSLGQAEIHSVEVARGGDSGNGEEYFGADSFSFGVEREMKESGEKGGTEDINIGVGELQECTISKSADAAPPTTLAQSAINGNSLGQAEILFVEVAGGEDSGKAWDGNHLMKWDNTKQSPWRDSAGEEYFGADSFSFGVEREMKESGEKGGTEDINIGIGELVEGADPAAVDAAIKSWSTSSDADDRPTEEVAFYYNRIAFQFAKTVDG